MTIEELYNEYNVLKQQNDDFYDIEIPLYTKFIHLAKLTNEEFSYFDIEKTLEKEFINHDVYQQRLFECRIDYGREFCTFKYRLTRDLNKVYIKYYFSIEDSMKDEFLRQFTKFIIINDIVCVFKMRTDKTSTDAVTVRVYNSDDYKKVFEFLQQFVDQKIKQPLFTPVIDNLGITIGDDNSYNRYIIDMLMNYFEQNNKDSISEDGFINYINTSDIKAELKKINRWYEFRYAYPLYNKNIEYSLNSFDIDDMINTIKYLQTQPYYTDI
ncbi:MAG: hypothetical protein LUH02_08455 [Erysipelotrichaceae bacterium]|nr:hypothetical protein [Erysipelotrichaceae bacterium]